MDNITELRRCKICLKEKELKSNFYLDKIYNCYGHQCRKCLAIKGREYRIKNFDKYKKIEKDYTLKNKQKKKEYDKQYRETNKDKIKERQKNNRINNREKINREQRERRENIEIKEKRRLEAKDYYYNNRTERIEYAKIYQKRYYVKIKNALYGRIRDSLREYNLKKINKTLEYTSCTMKFLVKYLESKFQEGMTWGNYGWGHGKWVIDHIIPCRYFNLLKLEEQLKCFHWSNLQPMWFLDNCQKLDKMPNGELARNLNGNILSNL